MNPATWWYLDQLKRKRAHLESDHERVERLMQRPGIDRATYNRLKLELDQHFDPPGESQARIAVLAKLANFWRT